VHRTHVGPVWTTAALLAEGEDELTAWRDAGHIAVDMETATVFGVAEWLGMRRVSVLSVFDNPLAGNHIARTAHDLTETRAAGERAADDIVRALIFGG
jgi:uridine phosphorylase